MDFLAPTKVVERQCPGAMIGDKSRIDAAGVEPPLSSFKTLAAVARHGSSRRGILLLRSAIGLDMRMRQGPRIVQWCPMDHSPTDESFTNVRIASAVKIAAATHCIELQLSAIRKAASGAPHEKSPRLSQKQQNTG